MISCAMRIAVGAGAAGRPGSCAEAFPIGLLGTQFGFELATFAFCVHSWSSISNIPKKKNPCAHTAWLWGNESDNIHLSWLRFSP